MKYLLDTNAADALLQAQEGDPIDRRFERDGGETVLCAPMLYECRFGALTARTKKERNRLELFYRELERGRRCLPFDQDLAHATARRAADLLRRGKKPGWFDCAIATTAEIHDLIIITNDRGFRLFPVKVEDWTVSSR